jgi:NAD(P)-dependent dehydrogenase (short-subunit alcohol dehydrogenase family)
MSGLNLDLAGKVAVVTGGANGIGLAAARLLAAHGASVWIFDLDREDPDGAAQRIGARAAVADVTDRQSLDGAFAAAMAADGTPDIVIANAGIASEADLWDHTAEDWERILRVNLTGAFHTVQAAARLMKPRRSGSIVLTASTNSYDGEARLAAYNASKAGLLGVLHTAANELGPYQIRVNAVCPGLIRTRLTERQFAAPGVLREYFRQIPLGRGGEPGEVAQASLFLASDLASYITGATLFVDGGQMASKFATWTEDTAEFTGGRWRLR